MADEAENSPKWVKAWISDLWELTNTKFVDFDDGKVDYEALGREEYEYRKALFFKNFKNSPRALRDFQQAKENHDKHVEAGCRSKGRPPIYHRADGVTGYTRSRRPQDIDDFNDFVVGQGLPQDIARDWYELSVAQGWADTDGKPYRNWKGALNNYCKSRLKESEGK